MRRAVVVVAGGIAAALLHAAPASADDQVVVRGVGFPSGLDALAVTGCASIFDTTGEPVTSYVSKAPAALGSRSLKYDLAGGSAVGGQYAVSSMTATSAAGLSVQAPGGSSGVAYAGYRAPADWSSSRIWIGRAELSAAPGGWQSVDATGLTYTWRQYDLATHRPVPVADGTGTGAEAPATVTAFAAAHGGDGPGFYTLGFGCDGQPFRLDALRSGTPGAVTTYDLEGFTSATAIGGSAATVTAGQPVTITGSLSDEAGRAVPHGLLVLESQVYGTSRFVPVEGAAVSVDGGAPTTTVEPSANTVYRWRFAGTWSVDGSVSPTFTVSVGTAVTAASEPLAAATPTARSTDPRVLVTGTTAPAKPGVRATLSRLTAGGPVPVATTRVDADGGYRFEVARPRFTGRYVVSVPATAGNLPGASPAWQIDGR